MNNLELQAVRRSLFLDVREAVEHVKTIDSRKMSVRAWQKWETGENPVPYDVHLEMMTLAGILEQMKGDDIDYVYYRTLAEFQAAKPDGNTVEWRMAQAVAAELICQNVVDQG